MNHRSHENTDHDYCTGIPLPMYVVDGSDSTRRYIEALEYAAQAIIETYHTPQLQGWVATFSEDIARMEKVLADRTKEQAK